MKQELIKKLHEIVVKELGKPIHTTDSFEKAKTYSEDNYITAFIIITKDNMEFYVY